MARNKVWDYVRKIGRDIDDQFWNRTGPHGAAELGAALNGGTGNGYVMYGPGGRADDGRPREAESPEQAAGRDDPGPEQERGGRSR